MKLKLDRRSQSGSSLPAVLVSVGILGAVSLAFMGVFSQMIEGQNTNRVLSNTTTLHDEIRGHLASEAACAASFRNLRVTTGAKHSVTQLRNPDNSVRYSLGTRDIDNTVEVSRMELDMGAVNPASPISEGVLSVWPRAVINVIGPKDLSARRTNLRIERNPASGLLVRCMAQASMSDGIWQRVPANISNIFYSGGNVGVGSSTPSAKLHVNDGQLNVTETRANGIGVIGVAGTGGGPLLYSAVNLSDYPVTRTWGIGFRSDNGNLVVGSAGAGFNAMDITQSGRIGIGTSFPATRLDVLGGVRPGNQAQAPNCDPSLEGTLRYNNFQRRMEYCDGTSFRSVFPVCRRVIAYGPAPAYNSVAQCAPDEIMTGGGGACETPGSGLCSGTSKGTPTYFGPHTTIAQAFSVDCWDPVAGTEACSMAIAICCK